MSAARNQNQTLTDQHRRNYAGEEDGVQINDQHGGVGQDAVGIVAGVVERDARDERDGDVDENARFKLVLERRWKGGLG